MERVLCANAKSLGAAGDSSVTVRKTDELVGLRTAVLPGIRRGKQSKRLLKRRIGRDDDNTRPRHLGMSSLPDFVTQRIYQRKVYWRVSNTFSATAFTLSDGANQFLVTSNTTGSLVCYADAWRLQSLDFYLKDSSSDEMVGMVFTPNSSTTDNFLDELPRDFTMNSAGTASYAHYKVDTSPHHPMGSWHKGTSTNQSGTLFSLSATSNMKDNCCWVIGTFEFVPNWTGNVPGYSISGAGTTTAGQFYTHSIMNSLLLSIGQNSLV